MRIRPSLAAFGLGLALALPAVAETRPASCVALPGILHALTGYTLAAPPGGQEDGWCVFDGARLTGGSEAPAAMAERLRLRGGETEAGVVLLEIDLAGLRVTPQLNDKAMDPRMRSLLRLQTADLMLTVARDEAADLLELRGGKLVLSGGTEATFGASIKGARLSLASVALGSVKAFDLTWRNDGRLLRPAMEAAGETLAEDASGAAAVDAAREMLQQLADTVPTLFFEGESFKELKQAIAALPHGRGTLALRFVSEGGIGAAQLGLLALAKDPSSPEALARLLEGCRLTVDWRPGLQP